MSFWNALKKVFRVADATANAAADDLTARNQIAVDRLTLEEATTELKRHKLSLGAYDGTRITLERAIDEKTNELAALERELEEFANLIKLGGDGAEDARTSSLQTLSEIKDLKDDLRELNEQLDEANAGYQEMFDEVQQLEDFIEDQAESLDTDEQQLAHYRAKQELAGLRTAIAGDGTACARLKDAATKRKQLLNERAGQVRTAQALEQKPAEQLRARVRERVRNAAAEAELEKYLASRKAASGT